MSKPATVAACAIETPDGRMSDSLTLDSQVVFRTGPKAGFTGRITAWKGSGCLVELANGSAIEAATGNLNPKVVERLMG